MKQGLLVLNVGSSSLKFALYSSTGSYSSLLLIVRGQISGLGSKPVFTARNHEGQPVEPALESSVRQLANHMEAISLALDWIRQQFSAIRLVAVGHRVVHGGRQHKLPALVTPGLIEELALLCALAPQHQPHNLAAIRAVREMHPGLTQVACFDTAFHADQPEVARRIPLPRRYREKGIMRYGFHGLSYEYITAALAEYNDGRLPRRLIVAHLGNGASLCAISEGKSIATTMGFSTLDGVMMGTRCGSMDPGVLLYLMREEKLGESALNELVYNQCGLLGLSAISADMQQLLQSEQTAAQQAIDSFCYSIQQAIGSLLGPLEGLDGLVFTGGIGEHAALVRARVCEKFKWLGMGIDAGANENHAALISSADSKVQVWVLPTNEELVIARHTQQLLNANSPA